MPTKTTNYDLNKPNVNSADDEDLWGDQLNENMDLIDAQLKTNADAVAPTTAAKTADYAITVADKGRTMLVDASGGDITMSAPTASTLGSGFNFRLLRIDDSANTVTFDPDATETVNGSATAPVTGQFAFKEFITDGSDWFISDESQRPAASAAETLAGTEEGKDVTPAGFADNKDLSTDGYYKLPGGLIIQWGTATDNVTETFPTPFTTEVFTVTATWYNNQAAGNSGAGVVIDTDDITLTEFKAYVGTAGSADIIHYIAIGY